MPNQTPAVVEKNNIDIGLGPSGGIDHSTIEENIDWTKKFTEINNLDVDGNSLKVRPGLVNLIDDTNVDNQVFSRLADMDAGLVGFDRGALYKLKESDPKAMFLTSVVLTNYLPTWDIDSSDVGQSNLPSITGVANTAGYKCISYLSAASSPGSEGVKTIIMFIDKESDIVLHSISIDGVVSMVCVNERYLHLYRSVPGDLPTFGSIDTDGIDLPIGGGVVSFTLAYGAAEIDDELTALSSNSSESVAAYKNSVNGNCYLVKWTSGGVESDVVTSGFDRITGIDATSGTFYASGVSETLDLSTLDLNLWVDGEFSASPWLGLDSTGNSGTNDLSEGTNPPSVGISLNGHESADFDGTNDRLTSTHNYSASHTRTAGFFQVMFQADAAASDAGASNPALNPCLVTDKDNGFFSIGYASVGGTPSVRCGVYDMDLEVYDSVAIAASLNTPHIFQVKWNGTRLRMRVDSGSWQDLTMLQITLQNKPLIFGTNYNSTLFFNGKIWSIIGSDYEPSDSDMDSIKDATNDFYGTSL